MQGKLWAEESVDLVLEGRRQLLGVAPCVSWATDAAAWLRMEGFAVVACGESFVLPGGQTPRSVDRMVAAALEQPGNAAAERDRALPISVAVGAEDRAMVHDHLAGSARRGFGREVLWSTGRLPYMIFCKASWSIVSRHKGLVLQPGRNRTSCGAIYVFSELGGKVDRKGHGQHDGHWFVAQAQQQRICYTGAGRVDSREIRSGSIDRALPISFTAGGNGTVRQTCLRAEVVAVKENKDEMCAGQH